MRPLSRTDISTVGDRDPVAASIEDFLAAEMAKGRDRLSKRRKEEGVSVSFASASAIAPNYDLAFIRLASALIDDDTYGKALRDILRKSLEAERRPGRA